MFLVSDARERHSTTILRSHFYGIDQHARENQDVYPPGFSVLIWSGIIGYDMLVSPRDHSEEVAEYDWDAVYAMEEPPPELDLFASNHSSYVVLVWGQRRTDNPDVLVGYERLRTSHSRTPMVFADGKARLVPNEEAEVLIRAAGHDPIWAD